MDKKKSLINVSVSIAFRFIMLIGSILVRRFLIRYIGNEINGLNSLYLSIVGFLSVAELGVGTAITFSMYKPIVEKNNDKVAALYQLFRKSYWVIGGIIFVFGLALIPALPYLAKDYTTLNISLSGTFFLMLVSIVLSYMFSAKTSLINAYKDDYITTTISSCGMILQYILQIITLIVTRSFAWYLICRIVAILVQWLATEILVKIKHTNIISYKKQTVDKETKSDILKNIKALFMHRIGGILVNSADSLIISAYIGIVMLGKFSNYTTIAVSMSSVIMLFFTPLTSIIGHVFVSEKENIQKYYSFFYSLNFILGTVFFLGYYAIIDNLITLLFGANLEISRAISFIITVNYFIQFMRQSTLLFRDSTGTFYNDRWKPLFEGLLNVVLSILFVNIFTGYFGESWGVVGVILATIITNLTICHIVEPYVLYKYAFKSSPRKHYIKNYIHILIFILALCGMHLCLQTMDNQWLGLLINGAISLLFSLAIIVLLYFIDKNFKYYLKSFVKGFLKKVKKH